MTGRIITDIVGFELTNREKKLLTNKNLFGIILFSRNYQNKQQIVKLINDIKLINNKLLLCIDHEGGRVWRFKNGFTHLPSMRKIGNYYKENKNDALKAAFACGVILANELLEIGIDFSFAPVLDIDYQNSSVIGDRAFSNNADVISILASQLIDGMHFAGMKCVAKHFPGHGFVSADSHLETPIDNRLRLAINNDILPFKKLISKIDAIMPAHIIYSKIDNKPAGFSSIWLKDILIKELNFKGIIFSDDLSMTGAINIGNINIRINTAFNAGIDIALICNNMKDLDIAIVGDFPVLKKLQIMQPLVKQNYDKMFYLVLVKKIL